jgi:molecular chaperone GrpE (heat shock protein)
MKSTYLQFTRIFFALALGAASVLGLSSCSKSETSADAEEAVDQLGTAAEDAISKVEEAVEEIEDLDAKSSAEAERVTEALRTEVEAAAGTVEARADEAAALIRDSVDPATPEVKPAPVIPVKN